MQERTVHRIEALVVFGVLAAVTIWFVFFFVNQRTQQVAERYAPVPEPALINPNLEPEYQSTLKNQWTTLSLAIANKDRNQLAGAMEAVLGLKVPENLKEFHLKVVMALAGAEQAVAANDITKLATASQTLSELEQQTPWLR